MAYIEKCTWNRLRSVTNIIYSFLIVNGYLIGFIRVSLHFYIFFSRLLIDFYNNYETNALYQAFNLIIYQCYKIFLSILFFKYNACGYFPVNSYI